jgi:exopolysaccharide production protein ExoY
MSFVGPRPITKSEIEDHYEGSAAMLLSVRPGLTGLWQSMGRNRLSYAQRRRLDVWFVQHVSVGIYFRILRRTIPRVVRGHDAF